MKNIINIASCLIKSFTLDKKVSIELQDDVLSIKKDNYINKLPLKLQAKFQRGYIDNCLAFINYHDQNIYNKYLPEDDIQKNIYFKCEEVRYEAIASLAYKGIAINLYNKWEYYSLINGYNLFDNVKYMRIDNVISFIIRKSLLAQNLPFNLEQIFSATSIQILNNYLPRIKANLYNQEEYAKIIVRISKDFKEIENVYNENIFLKETEFKENKEGNNPEYKFEEIVTNEELDISNINDNVQAKDKDISETGNQLHNLETYKPLNYKIYSSAYDEIIHADKLVSKLELSKLRQKLDSKIIELNKTLTKSINNFKRKLQSKKHKYLQANLEFGILDSSKFPLLVADHNFTNLYKSHTEKVDFNTVVTILIDSSGSMRGKPITIAAICGDKIIKILEECDIKTEILGFTTKDWQGGEVKKQWFKDGQPVAPGRLNAIRHIIYKDSKQNYKSSKKNIAVMLKDGLLKENIDGEALLWAYKRLIKKPQRRRILMVISDGAPIDESTLSNNQSDYLDRHLKEVIKLIEKQNIELIAIGIGHNVGNYYKNSITIKSVEELTDSIFNKLANIL